MVEIRKLEPIVKIRRMGQPRPETPTRHTNRVVSVRRRVDYPPPTPQPTPCVLWQGSCDPDGYGRMKREVNGRPLTVKVHRWIQEQYLGRPLKTQEFVLHLCDNPPCYRFDHLRIGSAYDNNIDMINKGRWVAPPVHHNGRKRQPLTAWQRQLIRREFESGIGTQALAERFGVAPRTINQITSSTRRAPTRDLLEEARERIRRAEERISAEAAALTSSEPASAEILAHDVDQEVWDE
jgi:transcriptional regulator with XRE-family HTH domain